MESKLRLFGRLVAVVAIFGLVAACGPGTIDPGYGRVYLELNADGSKCGDGGCSGVAEGVLEARAQIDEVSVRVRGRRVVLSDTSVNVDLLRLPDHAAELGIGLIPAGKINQIRLHVAEGSQSYVVEEGGSIVPMIVPSGMKSGIIVKGKWRIGACTENVITLTISDHHNAIHVHPDGQLRRYIFRPVIFAGDLITEEGECEDPGDNGGGDNGDNGDNGDDGDDGDDGREQECIPGDDAFPCPSSTGHEDGDGTGDSSGTDGAGDGSGDVSGDSSGSDGSGDGSGSDGTGDGSGSDGTDDGSGSDGTDDGSGSDGSDDGSGDGSGDGTCDPALDDTCRP